MLMRTVALSVLAAGLCVNPTIVLATGQTSIPVRVVNRSLEAGPKSPNLL